MKLKPSPKMPEMGLVSFKCPGCEGIHMLPTKGRGCYQFNGDFDSPTLKPPVLVQGFSSGSKSICNFSITDGQIYFLPNCTHDLADQTVELPEQP